MWILFENKILVHNFEIQFCCQKLQYNKKLIFYANRFIYPKPLRCT